MSLKQDGTHTVPNFNKRSKNYRKPHKRADRRPQQETVQAVSAFAAGAAAAAKAKARRKGRVVNSTGPKETTLNHARPGRTKPISQESSKSDSHGSNLTSNPDNSRSTQVRGKVRRKRARGKKNKGGGGKSSGH